MFEASCSQRQSEASRTLCESGRAPAFSNLSTPLMSLFFAASQISTSSCWASSSQRNSSPPQVNSPYGLVIAEDSATSVAPCKRYHPLVGTGTLAHPVPVFRSQRRRPVHVLLSSLFLGKELARRIGGTVTAHGKLLWWPLEVVGGGVDFGPFLLVRPVSAKTATFWPRSHQTARLTAQRDGT